eukprot:1161394-Pelagomonas_calceolata.AAC.4
MLIHRTTADGYKPEPDYHVITNVLSYMVDMQQVEAARKVGMLHCIAESQKRAFCRGGGLKQPYPGGLEPFATGFMQDEWKT